MTANGQTDRPQNTDMDAGLEKLGRGIAELQRAERSAQRIQSRFLEGLDGSDDNNWRVRQGLESLWKDVLAAGAGAEPRADFATKAALEQIERLRQMVRQPSEEMSESANLAVATLARLAARSMTTASRAPEPLEHQRYPVVIRPSSMGTSHWQDELTRASETSVAAYVAGNMTMKQHEQLAGHRDISQDLGYLLNRPGGPDVLDVYFAHGEADTMAEAWKTQTDEDWLPKRLEDIGLDERLALINMVSEVMDSEWRVQHAYFDDEFVAENRERWATFMRVD